MSRVPLEVAEGLLDDDSEPSGRRTMDESGAALETPEWLAVRDNGRVLFVRVADIDWIEASRNDVILHAGGRRLRKHHTMKRMETVLDPRLFVRIHRCAIVRIDFIRDLTPWRDGGYITSLKDGTHMTLSPQFRRRSPLLRTILKGIGPGPRNLPEEGTLDSPRANVEADD